MYDQFDPPDQMGNIYARGRGPKFVDVGTRMFDFGNGPQPVTTSEATPETAHAKPLFVTERGLVADTGLTPAAIRAMFGPPLPSGIACDQEVWAHPHIDHVRRAYIRPVTALLQFTDDEEDTSDYFLSADRQYGEEGTGYSNNEYYPDHSTPLPDNEHAHQA